MFECLLVGQMFGVQWTFEPLKTRFMDSFALAREVAFHLLKANANLIWCKNENTTHCVCNSVKVESCDS